MFAGGWSWGFCVFLWLLGWGEGQVRLRVRRRLWLQEKGGIGLIAVLASSIGATSGAASGEGGGSGSSSDGNSRTGGRGGPKAALGGRAGCDGGFGREAITRGQTARVRRRCS